MPGKWRLKDGILVPMDTAAELSSPPESKPMDGAPMYAIKHGEWKKDALRKFDKPSDSQIRSLIREDEEKKQKEMDTEPLIKQTKRDLETGKIKIHSGVLNDINKRVNPHGAEVDSRGVTHIVPIEKTKPEVSATVNPPQEGNLPGDSFGTVIERSLTRAKLEGRDNLRGKTY